MASERRFLVRTDIVPIVLVLGDLLLAMEDYSAVVRINPARTDALEKRAIYHFGRRSWHVAVLEFTTLIQKEPLNARARLAELFKVLITADGSIGYPLQKCISVDGRSFSDDRLALSGSCIPN